MTKWINSSKKIIQYKKYQDFYNIHLCEVWLSLIFAGILSIICVAISSYIGSNELVNLVSQLLLNLSIAMIGYLGFVIAALAVLTGSVSSKVLGRLQSRNKAEPLERIMLSFLLLGIVCGAFIIVSLTLYFVSQIPISSALPVVIILEYILSYTISWILIYSIKLIGDCIDLFFIVSEMENLIDDDNEKDYQKIYERYRVIALEKAVLKQTNVQYIEAYRNEIIGLIKNDFSLSDADKKILLNMVKTHFGD